MFSKDSHNKEEQGINERSSAKQSYIQIFRLHS